MAKQEVIMRYNLIIKKLRNSHSTFKEISDYLDLESDIQGLDFRISKRTFHRDLNEIRTIYNIDIQFDHSRMLYYIDTDLNSAMTERILEAFDTFNALNISDRLSSFIHFDNRQPQGTENLYGLLHAIKIKVQIIFSYRKFIDDTTQQRTVEPYALKESRDRWYVIGRDLKDGNVKSFGLDRLHDLEITKRKHQLPRDFNVDEHFRHCFGIIGPNANKPEEVVLSFTPFQGKYAKTLPLHHSQEIMVDNEKEFRIRMKIFITHDFYMEILRLGEQVKVIKPKRLANQVKSAHQKALEHY